MFEILLERFVIYNASGGDIQPPNNFTRFAKKRIITYIIILETNTFMKLDWNWDNIETVQTSIKEEIKESLLKKYSRTAEITSNEELRHSGVKLEDDTCLKFVVFT